MAQRESWIGAVSRMLATAMVAVGALVAPAVAAGMYTAVVSVPLADPEDATAREGALHQAQAAALERVLQRLTAARDHAALPAANGPNVAGYVETVSVLAEDDGMLRAQVTMRAEAIAQVLDGFGLAHATEPGPRLVVVPVYVQSEGDAVLWSGPNPWLDAWAAHARDASLVPVVAPFAEFGDLQALSTAEAVAGEGPALATLAARYEADGTVVAVYRPKAGGEAEVQLSVVALPDWAGTTSLAVAVGEPIPADAVLAAMAAIDRMWLERQIRPSYDGPVSAIEVTAVFASLADWIEIRRALDDAPVVEGFQVPVVSGQSARISLRHYATLTAVQADLSSAGIVMEQGAQPGAYGAGLILRLADAPYPSAQPGYAAAAPHDPFAPQAVQPSLFAPQAVQPSPFASQTAQPYTSTPQAAQPSPWAPATSGAAAAPTITPTIPTLRYEP